MVTTKDAQFTKSKSRPLKIKSRTAAARESCADPDTTVHNFAHAVLPVWLTAEEAANYLKVKPRTLLQWVRQGKVKRHPLSGTRRRRWRFLHAELDDILTVPSVALNKGRIA